MTFQEAYNTTKNNFINSLGSNDKKFLDRIYANGIDKYENRLKTLGFENSEKVLDFGCGFGQWSIALAKNNKEIYSTDISEKRIKFLNQLSKELSIDNINTQVLKKDFNEYSYNNFDAIFCYGVIFLTPWKKTLDNLCSLLKPGGKIYINYNSIGWYLFLWDTEHNKTEDYDPKQVASNAFKDTLLYERKNIFKDGMHLIMEPNKVEAEFRKLKFKNIQSKGEGLLQFNKKIKNQKPFFKTNYKTMPCVYETYAIKSLN